MTRRKLLVTSALPYANGSIHIGHLLEYIQTDIWVRFQKMQGHDCVYVCADDAHGTAVMLSAKAKGVSPEDLIQEVNTEHQHDFSRFHIHFDTYHSTHSPENEVLSASIYEAARSADVIQTKEIEQFFDEKEGIFLADRFIKGTCPFCGAEDQYGDSCEKCFATYIPDDLINPKSAISGETPVKKSSLHYFFQLSKFESSIKEWLSQNPVSMEVQNKLKEWLDTGLRDWDISRDAPYFGFKIPDTEDKYFYVWLDAPVGYIAATEKWAKDHDRDVDAVWRSGDFEIHHFIGKDILYFHTLFWPAMLEVADFKKPNKVNVHGFLTVNGEKMSKSRGTFILADTYLEHLNPEFLRYYYAAKLSGTMEDVDLNLEDFVYKVNSDVLGKVINIASRLGAILHKKLEGKLTTPDGKGEALLAECRTVASEIHESYESLNFAKAMRQIMGLADKVNQYIDAAAPWAMIADNPEGATQVCSSGLNAVRILMIYLSPVLPKISEEVSRFFKEDPYMWSDIEKTLLNQETEIYEHLASRLTMDDAKAIIVD